MSDNTFRFSKRSIESIDPPARGRATYKDKTTPGLTLRVTAKGTKSFALVRWAGGRMKRVTLGRFPALTVEQARKQAQAMLVDLNQGVDPVQKKRAERARGVTLAEVFKDYMADRTHSPNTEAAYKTTMQVYLPQWMDKPLGSITREAVAKRHKAASEHSATGANKAMRLLRALFNYASEEYLDENQHPLFPDNPVRTLSHKRTWNRETRRSSRIMTHELPVWWKAVSGLEPVFRDYFRFLILTGLRRREAAALRWGDIDFHERTLTVQDTKNHEAHTLPLSTYLLDMLKARHAEAESEWVFPSTRGEGHLQEPKAQVARLRRETGIQGCSPHDLRRTFISTAETLDLSSYALKRLLNHKQAADVTQGYLVLEIERLREPMERITDTILKAAEAKPKAEVVKLEERA